MYRLSCIEIPFGRQLPHYRFKSLGSCSFNESRLVGGEVGRGGANMIWAEIHMGEMRASTDV